MGRHEDDERHAERMKELRDISEFETNRTSELFSDLRRGNLGAAADRYGVPRAGDSPAPPPRPARTWPEEFEYRQRRLLRNIAGADRLPALSRPDWSARIAALDIKAPDAGFDDVEALMGDFVDATGDAPPNSDVSGRAGWDSQVKPIWQDIEWFMTSFREILLSR